MKKIKIITLTLIVSFSALTSKSLSAQCVKEGNIIIDAYYGYPYIWGSLLKAAYKDSAQAQGITLHNTNHIGGRFEYMVSDKIGLGAEYTFALATVDYPSNGKYYTAGIRKQRILGKMNIHFATTDKLDPYFTFGAGYKSTKIYTNEPGSSSSVKINLLPIAFRAGLGLRYFFTDNFGINAEVGIGGPAMQIGVSAKF